MFAFSSRFLFALLALPVFPSLAGADEPPVPMAQDYFNRGEDYLSKKRYDLAIAYFSEALALDSRLARAYLGRGLAYKAKGEQARAEADFKKAVELERPLDEVKQQRVSMYYSPTETGPTVQTGLIRLHNAYTMPVTMVVNSLTYRLKPGEEITLRLPAGQFTYEVPGIQGLVTRALEANATFQIKVNP